MPMPEATVNQNNGAVTWQNDIRLSGQIPVMKAIAVPSSVKKLANNEFREGILATYARHHPATRYLVNYVWHEVGTLQPTDGTPC